MNFSHSIKKKAFELGFSKIGIAKAQFYKEDKINLNYWNIKNGIISNKSYIVFQDLKLPLEFKLETSKIIKKSSVFNKVLNSILDLLKNEINYENLSEFLKKETEDYKIINFAKVVQINYSKISDAQKNLIF